MTRLIKTSAFSLSEMVVVIMIIGVLASIALPRYQVTVERVRSSEGVNILTALLGAQKRYATENGGLYTGTLSNLDVTPPPSTPANNFDDPTVSAISPLASIHRKNGPSGIDDYTLQISDTGVITCFGGGGGICTKMGYCRGSSYEYPTIDGCFYLNRTDHCGGHHRRYRGVYRP